MKKLFSTLALVMCLVSMSFAQMVDPIRWTSEMKQDGNNVEITLKATIDAGWHLYSLELPEGGPMATDIAFGRVEGAELVGEIEVLSDQVTKFEDINEPKFINNYHQFTFDQSQTLERYKNGRNKNYLLYSNDENFKINFYLYIKIFVVLTIQTYQTA